MSKMKRCLSLALVTLLMGSVALTGCGKKTDEKQPGNTDGKKETTTNKNTESKKLTWYLVGPGQEPETDKILAKANEYLKDKLDGATIDLKVFAYGDDYNQKVNTALASGEAFDICFTASWAADFRNNSAAGYFKQLDDYLAKDDTITKIVGQDFMNGVKIDGKTFAVPCNKEKVHNWGFLLKKDLVDKYKVDVSKIKKMEDLEPVFDQVKKGEPGITPLLSVQMEAPFKLLDWDNFLDDDIPGALYPDNRDTKVINQFIAPESVAHYEKMREYNKKEFLSPDAATMENFNDQLKTGKYFA
jgi:putative aldouronate transport system substrate-binding protein